MEKQAAFEHHLARAARWGIGHWKLLLILLIAGLLVVGVGVWRNRAQGQRYKAFSQAFYNTMQADTAPKWDELEQEYRDFSGVQWVSLQRLLAAAKDKDWDKVKTEALALSQKSESPELSAMALFAAARALENDSQFNAAQKVMDDVIAGPVPAYATLARIEKGRLLIENGQVEAGKKELQERLKELDADTEAPLIDWVQDLLLWTETNAIHQK